MAVMLGNLYDALIEAGASRDAARAAAEEVAAHREQRARIRNGLIGAKALVVMAGTGVAVLVLRAFFG